MSSNQAAPAPTNRSASSPGLCPTILVTGGCGFIGSNFVRGWLRQPGASLLNLDKLTYAGHLASLADLAENPRYQFVQGDICNFALLSGLLAEHRPRAVVHLAAESHVDRSIAGPQAFLETNIQGTFALLEAVRAWLPALPAAERKRFRFLHVSTDEVYGSLGPGDPPFREDTPYAPNSPYAASKAASDHLVHAYEHTYGLPAIITNCSNNYGPYQLPEKLIPLIIRFALEGRRLPVYGDGLQVRDWLYVEDHCAALRLVLDRGRPGSVYNIGGAGGGALDPDGAARDSPGELTNLALVRTLCALLDELHPAHAAQHGPASRLIQFVEDRPGHDRRYAVDSSKIRAELGWAPKTSLADGLRKTVSWYLQNSAWLHAVTAGSFGGWLEQQYKDRRDNEGGEPGTVPPPNPVSQ